jgi:hypothetical protein
MPPLLLPLLVQSTSDTKNSITVPTNSSNGNVSYGRTNRSNSFNSKRVSLESCLDNYFEEEVGKYILSTFLFAYLSSHSSINNLSFISLWMLSIHLSFYLSIHRFIYQSIYHFIYLYIVSSIYLSKHLSISLSIYPYT